MKILTQKVRIHLFMIHEVFMKAIIHLFQLYVDISAQGLEGMGNIGEKNNGKQLGSVYKTQCQNLMSYYMKALTAARTNCFATRATQEALVGSQPVGEPSSCLASGTRVSSLNDFLKNQLTGIILFCRRKPEEKTNKQTNKKRDKQSNKPNQPTNQPKTSTEMKKKVVFSSPEEMINLRRKQGQYLGMTENSTWHLTHKLNYSIAPVPDLPYFSSQSHLKGVNMPMKARFSCTLTDQNRGDEGVQGYPSVQEDAHNKLMLLLGLSQKLSADRKHWEDQVAERLNQKTDTMKLQLGLSGYGLVTEMDESGSETVGLHFLWL
ncbi:hypothetical protein Anapl_11671 [Anas platyrhynchos]|uniref:Uncharacterized protein n=1 Tax=Anas platyrhynchos TaxID=8839 RepID=R0JLE7_ANAPL|nr:hypothetical protein Anapl_11671 [Anas platyrhynchos]